MIQAQGKGGMVAPGVGIQKAKLMIKVFARTGVDSGLRISSINSPKVLPSVASMNSLTSWLRSPLIQPKRSSLTSRPHTTPLSWSHRRKPKGHRQDSSHHNPGTHRQGDVHRRREVVGARDGRSILLGQHSATGALRYRHQQDRSGARGRERFVPGNRSSRCAEVLHRWDQWETRLPHPSS